MSDDVGLFPLPVDDRPTGRDRYCPRCGSPPTNVYRQYTSGGFMSYCSICQKSYGSAPPRPGRRKPRRIPQPRPKPITAYTLDDIRADPVVWLHAANDLTSNRWQHLRRLLIDESGGRCTIGRPGCTGAATEVDHGVPRSVAAPAPVVDLSTLRPCCQSCNHAEWQAYADLLGPPRPVPTDLTASGLALLRWLDDNDVARSFGRRKIDRLPGRPPAVSSAVDDVSIWRRFNSPATPYPPLRARPPSKPIGRTGTNAQPRRPIDDVAHLVDALDRLAVPLDVGPGPALAALAAAGLRAAFAAAGLPNGANFVDDAQRWRRAGAAV